MRRVTCHFDSAVAAVARCVSVCMCVGCRRHTVGSIDTNVATDTLESARLYHPKPLPKLTRAQRSK